MKLYPTKILVASDRSKPARQAIQHAYELSQATGSELHVVHVGLISQFTNPDNMSTNQYQRLKQEAQDALDDEIRWAKQNVTDGKDPAGVHLRMGRTDGEVMKLAEELSVGLIVIGSRGLWEIERVLLGNDAESIARHAPCPVLVVRDKE